MSRRNMVTTLVAVGALGAAAFGMKAFAGDPPKGFQQGNEVTLEGRVVDLQCFMTQKFASTDHAKCTADCIRAGVPCALETSTGLVIVGEGAKSPAAQLAPLALEHVKINGKLYERDGVRYIDLIKAEKEVTKTSSAVHRGK